MKDLPEIVGVSATAVKNACRKFDIPVPDQGHWQRARAGKKIRTIALTDRAPGMSDELVLGGSGYDRNYRSTDGLDEPLPPPPSFPVPIEDVRAAVSRKIGRVTVPRGRHGWHTAIRRLFATDDKKRAKQAERQFAWSWDAPLFDSPFEQRRLGILNALFLAVAKCGGKPEIRGREAVEVSLTVHQQHVPLKLLATKDLKRNNTYRSPGDRLPAKEPLSLVVSRHWHGDGARISWADTADTALETCLTEIAVEFVVIAESLHRENAERHHAWLIERKADHERRKAEAEAVRLEAIRSRTEAFETAKRDMLLGHARDLDHARTLRRLVEDVPVRKGDAPGDDAEAWAQFVRAEADRLDPVTGDRFLDVMKLRLEDFGEIEE